MNKNRRQRKQGKGGRSPAGSGGLPFAIPTADRGGRWVCKRKDCHRQPVNFGVVCTCCGQARK